MRIDEVALWSSNQQASSSFIDAVLPTLDAPPHAAASVRFLEAAAGRADPPFDSFWKISVFADDVDQLRQSINRIGTDVSEPTQFLDIGYLCHLHEPGGNEIELLQRTFQPQRAPRSDDGLSSIDSLGLITLRVSDIDLALRFFENGLGMRSLATMEVGQGGQWRFGLRFLAWTNDRPPVPNRLDALENREWLYQRPYTIVELQYGPPLPPAATSPGPGLAFISASTPDIGPAIERLDRNRFDWTARSDRVIETVSPDGHILRIAESPLP